MSSSLTRPSQANAWELRSIEKPLRNASKKTTTSLEPVVLVGSGSPENGGPQVLPRTAGRPRPPKARIWGKAVPAVRDHAFEDNAFHQLERSGCFWFPIGRRLNMESRYPCRPKHLRRVALCLLLVHELVLFRFSLFLSSRC